MASADGQASNISEQRQFQYENQATTARPIVNAHPVGGQNGRGHQPQTSDAYGTMYVAPSPGTGHPGPVHHGYTSDHARSPNFGYPNITFWPTRSNQYGDQMAPMPESYTSGHNQMPIRRRSPEQTHSETPVEMYHGGMVAGYNQTNQYIGDHLLTGGTLFPFQVISPAIDRRGSLEVVTRPVTVLARFPTAAEASEDQGDDAQAAPDTIYTVQCPCGHILSGAHAKGNLTRHQRSLICKAVAETRECLCPDCGQVFRRSDAVLTHRRKRHGAPPGPVRPRS